MSCHHKACQVQAHFATRIYAFDYLSESRVKCLQLKVSVSGKGNCYDNAAVETFFKTIKAELIWRRSWATRRQAEMAIFEYINGFYNPRRRHSAQGWKSPVAFERKVA
jgi:putative transposase